MVWSIKGQEKKRWAVDFFEDSYLVMAGANREQHLFRYYFYFEKQFISLELHGLDNVLMLDLPVSLQSRLEGVQEAIKSAFKIYGRWGSGGAGGDFDAVKAQF